MKCFKRFATETLRLRIFFMFLGLMTAAAVLGYAAGESNIRLLSEIPVQHGGRVKPFQSFAYETAFSLTGQEKFQGLHPVELLWEWMAQPEKWMKQPLIPVSYKPLQKEFALMLIGGRISPEVALGHQPFLNKVEAAFEKQRRKEALSQEEKERLEIYERASLFRLLGKGQVPGWIAHPEDPTKSWLPIETLATPEGQELAAHFFPRENIEDVRTSLQLLIEAIQQNPLREISPDTVLDFKRGLDELFQSRGIVLDQKLLNMEITYHRLKPFSWAWKFYLACVLVSLLSIGQFKGRMPKIVPFLGEMSSQGLLFMGFLLHSYGFYLRSMIAGRPPVTNMYESIVWVSWAVVLFSFVLSLIYRAPSIRMTASLVASFALVIAQSFPAVLDPFVSPLVPVLRSNLWLTVHVLTITLSYGAFALAWGIGHGVILGAVFFPAKIEPLQKLNLYLYRALQIGVVLLASGTVLGGVWANYSWGRFWGWDPKETWALIALLGYLAVLHGRFAGWLDPFGFAVASTAAFLGVLMAWYGVNFVLAAGLHSYGFGGGGAIYVLAAAMMDLIFIGWGVWLYRKRSRPVMSLRAE